MLFGIGMALSIGSIVLGKLIVNKISLPIFMKITYALLLVSGIMLLF
jgi:hypothetical protein